MNIRIAIFTWIPVLFITSTTHAQTNSQQITEQITVDGMKRKIVTYIPANDKPALMPVVIALHGGFATPKAMFRLADFRSLADKEKFIVVCPASKRMWHDGADSKGIDDVKFIDEVITYMIKKYRADPQRIYVTGISNGGFMTSRLACQIPDRIAAVAVVAATLDVGEGYDLKNPMPIMYIHGTSDPIISYNGGKLFGRKMFSHRDIIEKWVKMNDCYPEPLVSEIRDNAGDGTKIFKQEYVNKVNGLKVISYTIENGGHTWPGGRQYFPKFIIGKTTHNLNACQTIWDFFKTCTRKQT
ncbi:alpha/beta hydrolase family esterase [Mucilaginibacter calamicampi]|uniref:Alpha/beta hydrolase family esterase n=1 Tax=Mucilaginibacter calamicampi TaxID=1302352 RepID=A0ABW2YX93_9SPHI